MPPAAALSAVSAGGIAAPWAAPTARRRPNRPHRLCRRCRVQTRAATGPPSICCAVGRSSESQPAVSASAAVARSSRRCRPPPPRASTKDVVPLSTPPRQRRTRFRRLRRYRPFPPAVAVQPRTGETVQNFDSVTAASAVPQTEQAGVTAKSPPGLPAVWEFQPFHVANQRGRRFHRCRAGSQQYSCRWRV